MDPLISLMDEVDRQSRCMHATAMLRFAGKLARAADQHEAGSPEWRERVDLLLRVLRTER